MIGERIQAAPVAPDTQRDLLCHRAAGHEDRRIFAEFRREAGLEALDEIARTVAVGFVRGIGVLRQLRECTLRRNRQMMGQRARAGGAKPRQIGVGYRRNPSSLINLR